MPKLQRSVINNKTIESVDRTDGKLIFGGTIYVKRYKSVAQGWNANKNEYFLPEVFGESGPRKQQIIRRGND